MTASPRSVSSKSTGLRAGTRSVGLGVVVLGLTTYGFFVVTSRSLTPDGFAALSVVYTLLYTVGAGLLQPVEAHLSRTVASAEARGHGAGTAVRRTAGSCLVLVGAVVVLCLALSDVLADSLFAGDDALMLISALGLVSFAATYLMRGVLGGSGRFVAYSVQLGLEGGIRLVGALGLHTLGVTSVAPYAVLVAGSPLVAVMAVGVRRHRHLDGGPSVAWRHTAGAVGVLAACGVMSQLLANAGPLLVAVLAAPDEFAEAGRLMAALVLVRIPLFLFSAAQAVLVPSVATAFATGRVDDVRRSYRSLSLLVGGLALVSSLGLAAVGPQLLALVFGAAYVLSRSDLLLLCVFAAAQVHAQLSYQTLLGLERVQSAFVGWSVGVVVLGLGTLSTSSLVRRVEVGLALGSCTAAAVLAVAVALWLRSARTVGSGA